MSRTGCDKVACCRRYCCNALFAAAIHAVLVRFSEDADIVRDLVHLEEDVVVGKEMPLACVRRAVWDMLYADDAGIVSKSA